MFSHFVIALVLVLCVFFNDTATPEIYTLSLHDALPISVGRVRTRPAHARHRLRTGMGSKSRWRFRRLGSRGLRSEEHTSELQSLTNLVCRLLLEKKKARPRDIILAALESSQTQKKRRKT